MKLATLTFSLLFLCPALLSAQKIDFDAVRSAEQLRLGVQAFHRGAYSDAITALEKSVSYQPSSTLAQSWLGRAQWKAGFEPEAQRTWQQIVDSGAGTPLIRDWISVLSARRGLGRELSGDVRWVVSAQLDGMLKGGYPFRRPTSVRPRSDGSFWVVAFGSNEIVHFDANFRLLSTFRGGLQGFVQPYDLAEAADGTLYISEYGADRITKCSPTGDRIKTFGGTGRGDGMLLGPQYLALDDRGYLWVADWGNSRVVRFDLDGRFVQSIPGIQGPTGLATYENRVYVSERSQARIQVYDLSGNPLGTVGEGTLKAPEGISFTPDGTLLVADGNRILECDLEREIWKVRADTSADTRRLVQQAVSPNGTMLAADFDASKVVLITDTQSLYSGMVVRVDRVNAVKFPEVFVDVAVETRLGKPVVGLGIENFIVTENHYSVGKTAIALANSRVTAVDVTLLVDRSTAFEQYRADATQAILGLYDLVTKIGRINAVSAGEHPSREADFGETRLRFAREALQSPASAAWRFDAGAKLAGDQLITAVSGARRAIVFFTVGAMPQQAFGTYSLTETAAYLRNNGVAFYPIFFGSGSPDEQLGFLAEETGGKLYSIRDPGGMQQVVKDIRGQLGSVYTLHYQSPTPPQFGDTYIPLEIEVTAQRVSGRDEAGYYAPPSDSLPATR